MASNSSNIGLTISSTMCASIDIYIANLTSSYVDQTSELKTASATTIMFTLTVLFFIINLFSTRSDINASLDPKLRYLLATFIPVMSTLFSEAKYSSYAGFTSLAQLRESQKHRGDISQQAGFILAWMLLVEILRKKIDKIQMRGYSATIYRAGRVAWLGLLVFFNVHGPGRKALFSILWIICATIMVQRVAYTELGKRSYAYGKTARLVKPYLADKLGRRWKKKIHEPASVGRSTHDIEQPQPADDQHGSGDQVLKECPYIVKGEEKLMKKTKPEGYEFHDLTSDVITVGKVWKLVEGDHHNPTGAKHQDRGQQLKRLSLSFALFKQLRRLFEQQPGMTKDETTYCRNLLFKGLCQRRQGSEGSAREESEESAREESARALFQVMSDEVNFLSEYYHSVIPVVLASPSFFLINYIIVFIVVAFLCFMTIVLCGNGNVGYAFSSLKRDNFVLNCGIFTVASSLASRAATSPAAFYTVIDLVITIILIFIFIYEEIWEFIVFMFSNWFVVSLLCKDIVKLQSSEPTPSSQPPSQLSDSASQQPSKKYTCSRRIRSILLVRSNLINPSLKIKQFSVLNLHWPTFIGIPSILSLFLKKTTVPKLALMSITESLLTHIPDNDNAIVKLLSNGNGTSSPLVPKNLPSWAQSNESVVEIILMWHIATTLLESDKELITPKSKDDVSKAKRHVATRLSKYCAYLVAFQPELLPDNLDHTESVFEELKKELKRRLGCFSYYFSCKGTRINKIKEAVNEGPEGTLIDKGVALARKLKAGRGSVQVWELLANVWTNLIIYVAPSSDEECIKAHENLLSQGAEFVTILWALTTHTGISRQEKTTINIYHEASESAGDDDQPGT
ncbi:hypothetical protein ACP4OV_030579 [Aristida adscensionis]